MTGWPQNVIHPPWASPSRWMPAFLAACRPPFLVLTMYQGRSIVDHEGVEPSTSAVRKRHAPSTPMTRCGSCGNRTHVSAMPRRRLPAGRRTLVVDRQGIEPWTSSLQSWRSPAELPTLVDEKRTWQRLPGPASPVPPEPPAASPLGQQPHCQDPEDDEDECSHEDRSHLVLAWGFEPHLTGSNPVASASWAMRASCTSDGIRTRTRDALNVVPLPSWATLAWCR
jgi:hypothetical protein